MRQNFARGLCLAFAIQVFSGPALAQTQEPDSDIQEVGKKAENVVRQPMKDVGLMKDKVPEVLIDAQRAPYTLAGIKNCTHIRQAISSLDDVLGPDIDQLDNKGDPLPGRLAEAGAKSVIYAFIPFRSLIREASGAAEADRKSRALVAAGFSRRGFLKGVALERKCKA